MPSSGKFILINIDDFGLSEVNEASLDIGWIKNVSVLINSSNYSEVFKHDFDAGIHFDVSTKAEIKQQLIKAMSNGLEITHVDSHKHTIYQTPSLFEELKYLSDKFKFPIVYPKSLNTDYFTWKQTEISLPKRTLFIDDYMFTPHFWMYYARSIILSFDEAKKRFLDFLDTIKDGVTLLAVHPSTKGIPEKIDHLLLKDEEIIEKLNTFKLITWKDLAVIQGVDIKKSEKIF